MNEIDDSTLMAECYQRLAADPALLGDLYSYFRKDLITMMKDEGA